MKHSQYIYAIIFYSIHNAIIVMGNMPIARTKEDVLRYICKTLRKSVQAVNSVFQFQYESFCIVNAVLGNVGKDMFKIILGI